VPRYQPVIPSERSDPTVIPSERSDPTVIPSERSESRDLHLPFRSADPSTSLGMTTFRPFP